MVTDYNSAPRALRPESLGTHEMDWWGWIIGGAILLGAELGFVNAQFYLVFIGGAALIVGMLSLLLPGFSDGMQWALFALLAIVSMVSFRGPLYRRLRSGLPHMPAGPPGGVIILPQDLSPGQSCQAEHGGSFWTVCNDSPEALARGARVRIASVQGLTLLVRPER